MSMVGLSAEQFLLSSTGTDVYEARPAGDAGRHDSAGGRRGLWSTLVAMLLLVSASAHAETRQWRSPASEPVINAGDGATADDEARNERVETRRERLRMQWLRSVNVSNDSRMREMPDPERRHGVGLSREERHRLRSDIREAGHSAYAPPRRGGRDLP